MIKVAIEDLSTHRSSQKNFSQLSSIQCRPRMRMLIRWVKNRLSKSSKINGLSPPPSINTRASTSSPIEIILKRSKNVPMMHWIWRLWMRRPLKKVAQMMFLASAWILPQISLLSARQVLAYAKPASSNSTSGRICWQLTTRSTRARKRSVCRV